MSKTAHVPVHAAAPTVAKTVVVTARAAAGLHKRQIAEMTAMLNSGGEEASRALTEMKGQIKTLAFEETGCRLVQLAVQVSEQKLAAELVEELHGSVRCAVASPHGNYVIGKIIEVMPVELTRFVAGELRGISMDTARHRYGCRIMCRLLEHSATDELTVAMVDEALDGVGDLCRHCFGHHVVESTLEHGLTRQKRKIIAALLTELPLGGSPSARNFMYVLRKAVLHCEAPDKAAVQQQLDIMQRDPATLQQ
jgi:hypothetical protein